MFCVQPAGCAGRGAGRIVNRLNFGCFCPAIPAFWVKVKRILPFKAVFDSHAIGLLLL